MTKKSHCEPPGMPEWSNGSFFGPKERKSYLNQSFASLKKGGRDNTLLLEKQFKNGKIYKMIFDGLCVILRRMFVLKRRDSYG